MTKALKILHLRSATILSSIHEIEVLSLFNGGVHSFKVAAMWKVTVPGHLQSYDFSKISEIYGEAFARDLARGWLSSSGAVLYASSSAFGMFCVLRRFLFWIAESEIVSCQSVFGALSQRTVVDHYEWIQTLALYRLHIIGKSEISLPTKATVITQLNSAMNLLIKCNLAPDVARLKHPSGAEVDKKARPSLALLTRSDASLRRSRDMDTVLRDQGVDPSGLSMDRSSKEISSLNADRIAALYKIAERSIMQCYDDFTRGQRLINLDVSDEIINDPKKFIEAEDDLLLAAILKAIKNGCRKFSWKAWFCAQNNSVKRRVYSMGGGRFINRLLEGTADGVVALETMLLCDTGLNVEVVEGLFFDFTSKAVAGRRRISTIAAAKLRAGGKVVEGDLIRDKEIWLPVGRAGKTVSGVRAVEMWLAMSEPIRARADQRTAEHLLLLPCGHGWEGVVRPASAVRGRIQAAWKRLLGDNAQNPVIGGLSICRTNIRPSVAQIIDSRANFDALSAQVWLSHSRSGVTWPYLNVPWMRRELDQQIRRFQQLLESALASGLPDIAHELGLSKEELARRIHLAEETGLGTLCLDAYAGIQPGTQKGRLCDRLDRCASGCPLMRFVPTESSLQALVAFNKALRHAEDSWLRSRPERWVEAWLPWLALTEAALRTLEKSPVYSRKLKASVHEVQEAINRGEICLFEPY